MVDCWYPCPSMTHKQDANIQYYAGFMSNF